MSNIRYKDVDLVGARRDHGVPSYKSRYEGAIKFIEDIEQRSCIGVTFSQKAQRDILQAIAVNSSEYLGIIREARAAGFDGEESSSE